MTTEIVCPHCGARITHMSDKAMVYCPCCAAQLPEQEKPVIEVPVTEPLPDQNKSSSAETKKNEGNEKYVALGVFMVGFGVLAPIGELIPTDFFYKWLFWDAVIALFIYVILKTKNLLVKAIVRHHDKEIDQNPPTG